jgi:glycosyltransferase involved in cell wall biosynthesis
VDGKLKRIYNSSIAAGERVIAVSHFLADYLEKNYGTDPKLVRVIHRGVALEKFHPNSVTPERLVKVSRQLRLPEGAAIILCPARISRVKGGIYLLDAVKKLGRRDVFCVFLGSDHGNEHFRQELEGYINQLELGGQVRIEMKCDDMPAAYMIANVVVVPSLTPEGFGRVAVEAQAMGRPCIATEHGGSMETIVKDETGWLVAPGDVDTLAQYLDEALSLDARQRAMLATTAMSHVAHRFTNEQMCNATLDVYAELLLDRAAAPKTDSAQKAAR